MAFFDPDRTIVPVRAPLSRSRRIGLAALSIALVSLFGLSLLPTSYVIQQPGPVYDTLGSAPSTQGDEVPLIRIDGARTYPTDGTLDLLTVQVVGSRERTPTWFELAQAWFDPSRAVVPLEAVFPTGQSQDERDEQNSALMIDSQQEATAAALTELGYDVEPELEVVELTDDSAAEGLLEPGDIVTGADGRQAASATELAEIVNDGDGDPVTVDVIRDGDRREVEVQPDLVETDDGDVWRMGVLLQATFVFPFDVTLQLDNVGGPSAGMMFALGIIDTLTPGNLNDGQDVAGTGTITADGAVGPIGGIRQKLYGAKDAGADVFLAPAANCEEVVGHIPSGLRVFSVATLQDSLDVLGALGDEAALDALPTCTG